MKKLFALLFILLLSVTAFGAEQDYTLENGVLTVYGSGVCERPELTDGQWQATEKIVITEGFTEIDEWAFSGYFSDYREYTSVTLPEGLKKIGKAAFAFARELSEINLPSTLTEIGYGAFNETAITEIALPSGVTEIAPAAFNSSRLESVTLPDTLVRIGEFAFQNTPLKEISLPSSLEIIEPSAFAHCRELKSVVLPNGVKEIGRFAFYGCTGLLELHIPSSVHTIGLSMLRDVAPELRVYIDDTSEYFTVEDDIVFSKDKKTLVRYPAYKTDTSYTVPSGVEHIFAEAFVGCNALTELTLPDGLKSIGGRAFAGCEGLKRIVLPVSVEKLDETLTGNGTPEFYAIGVYSASTFFDSSFTEIVVLNDKLDVATDGWPMYSFGEDTTIYCNQYSATDLGAKELAGDFYAKIVYLDENHEHKETVSTVSEPTCSSEGERVYTCSICGLVRSEAIERLEHSTKETLEPSSCYKEGTRTLACEVCGALVWRDPVPKTEHNYGEAVISSADCRLSFTSERECIDCGRLLIETLDGGEHSFSAWESVKAATLSECGSEQRECTVCGETETRETERLALSDLLSPYVPYALAAIVFILFALIGAAVKKRDRACK